MPQKKKSKALPTYKIQNDKEKGKLVVAGRHLKQGFVIFIEEPLLFAKDIAEDDIMAQYEKLEDKEKEKVLSLVVGLEEEEERVKVMSLFKRKNINSGESASGQALYYVLSRIKHSCGPNVVLIPHHDKAFGRIEIRACRAIKKGEELRADYLPGINLFEPKEVRTKVFGDKFECDCHVCTQAEPDFTENELTRQSIKERYRNTTIYETLGDFPQAYDNCKAMLGFLEYLDDEIFPKRVSVTLECWQLAVLAKLQRPDVVAEVEKYKTKSKELCQILGPSEMGKWKNTEKNIEERNFVEFDTVKLRASGPWAVDIITNLSNPTKVEGEVQKYTEVKIVSVQKIEPANELNLPVNNANE